MNLFTRQTVADLCPLKTLFGSFPAGSLAWFLFLSLRELWDL